MYLGIAIAPSDESPETLQIAIAVHDGTYSMDFAVYYFETVATATSTGVDAEFTIPEDEEGDTVTDFIIRKLTNYRVKHCYKFAGAGITPKVAELCPDLSSRLWKDLDVVTLTLNVFRNHGVSQGEASDYIVDEESDEVVRKALK